MTLAAGLSLAQMPKKDKTPRALAVVEMSADGKAAVRLTPVAILIGGRFWDASIYRADPRPFALDPGNVYEVARSGQALGFFTVNDARHAMDQWTALGNWQAYVEKPPKPAKLAKIQEPADDDRPVLHRREAAAQNPQPPPKSPENSPSPSASSSGPAAATTDAPSADDPNRPVLRRGKPKPQPAAPPEESSAGPGPPSAKSAALAVPKKGAELLPAISDADGPEPRSFTYPVQPDEQKKLTKDVSEIAKVEVARYAKDLPALRFAPSDSFDHVTVQLYDLDNSNNPHVVLTARVPAMAPSRTAHAHPSSRASAPDFFFYVTVVGQTDLYGQMRKLFSTVTDSRRLDASPRLELIDAVDAEGTGRGDLLFRAWSGSTPTYQLYHVGPDSLRKLFDSGGA